MPSAKLCFGPFEFGPIVFCWFRGEAGEEQGGGEGRGGEGSGRGWGGHGGVGGGAGGFFPRLPTLNSYFFSIS